MPSSLASTETTASPQPLYYVKNFTVLLDTVCEMYGDLLTEHELAFADSCRTMDRPALRLFLRLYSRVGPIFRSDKLHYAEIPQLDLAAQTLAKHRLLSINATLPSSLLLDLLLKGELLELLSEHCDPATFSRASLKKELLKRAKDLPPEEIRDFCELRFEWYALQPCYILPLFKLLFFGNWYQDLTEFIQTDIGMKRYESIHLDRSQRFFQSREQIENALRYRYLQRYLARPTVDWDQDAVVALTQHLPETFEHPFLKRRMGKICNAVGYFLEKSDRKLDAMAVYSLTDMPPARERFIRLQIDRGDWESALLQAIMLNRTAVDDSESQFALRAKRKIQGYLKLAPDFVPAGRWHSYQIFVDQQPDESIESATIRALAEQKKEAFFAENRFWLNLLGLTFWDIVFMDLPGVFLNPFQRGPVDLWQPEFARRRAHAIDQRLAEVMDRHRWRARIRATYEAKQGIDNALVAWSGVNWDNIERVSRAAKQEVFCKIFERLIKNLKYYRVGMPDLIVFTKSRMQLVEVKSKNDRLSPYQIGWLTFLYQNGISCAVAKALPQKAGDT